MISNLDRLRILRLPRRTATLAVVALLGAGCGGNTAGSGGGGDSGAFAIVDLSVPGGGGKPMMGNLSADGSTVAASVQMSTNWYVWNKKDGWRDTQIASSTRVTGDQRLSADGKSFFANTVSGPYLYANGSSLHLPAYPGATAPTAFAFSADGHRILGGSVYSGVRSDSGTLIQWTDGSSPVAIPGPLPVGGGTIGYLNGTGYGDAAKPIGFTNVFVLSGPGMPHLKYSSTLYWSIHDGVEIDFPAVSGAPSAVSPNGQTFASASSIGARVWDLAGSERTFAIAPPTDVDVSITKVDDAGDVAAGGFLPHGDTINPWIWDNAHGVRLLADVLNANGLSAQFKDYSAMSIVALSADGKSILLSTTKTSGAASFALVHLAGK